MANKIQSEFIDNLSLLQKLGIKPFFSNSSMIKSTFLANLSIILPGCSNNSPDLNSLFGL